MPGSQLATETSWFQTTFCFKLFFVRHWHILEWLASSLLTLPRASETGFTPTMHMTCASDSPYVLMLSVPHRTTAIVSGYAPPFSAFCASSNLQNIRGDYDIQDDTALLTISVTRRYLMYEFMMSCLIQTYVVRRIQGKWTERLTNFCWLGWWGAICVTPTQ